MSVTNTFTDTISVGYSGNGSTVSSKIGTYTGSRIDGVAAVVPASTTNSEIDVAFGHVGIVSMIMSSDQPVTVKTNSTSAPDQTFTLVPSAAMVWGNDFVSPCPVTADVTKLFVTNAGATDAKFNLRVLLA